MRLKKPSDPQPAADDAIRGETLRPMPRGLHRRIERGVRYVVLQDRERRFFRESMAAGAAGLAALGALVGVACWQFAPLRYAATEMPGVQGQFDRLIVFFHGSWLKLAGVAGCAMLATVALALLLAHVPAGLLTYTRNHR